MIKILLALLFLLLGLKKNVSKLYNYLIIFLGLLLIIYNLNVVFNNEDFLNLNVIIFGPLLVILGVTENESLKNLSFIIGISILLYYIKESYNIELFNKF
tara:strand:- start:226 stop:525 length:300 start_codon:yes stop_codon:yes gene_type:complete